MPAPLVDLCGETALVTGAARGIGYGIASVLLAAGARVIIADVDDEAARAAADSLGAGATAEPFDVTSEAAVEAALARIDAATPLTLIINNAGVAEPVAPIRRQSLDAWQRVMDVNVRGPFLVSRAALTRMIPRRRGAIVNVASIAGLVGFAGSNAYGVSKAAAMMTQTLAGEVAKFGIRVNAVAPGVIEAPILTTVPAETDALVSRVPLGRLGTPVDVGHAVAFLGSAAASYISGVVLPVDGGWTAFGGVPPAYKAR
jgi:NAD(P)-dependent dehydrogenase (short-subunit alcohol dehydrogenase family)